MQATAFEMAQDKYAPKIRTFAESAWRFLPGYGREDLEAEMLEVLWICTQGYHPDRGAQFSTYFWTAAKRRLISIRRFLGAKKRAAEWVHLDGDALAAAVDEILQEFSAEEYAIAFETIEERKLLHR